MNTLAALQAYSSQLPTPGTLNVTTANSARVQARRAMTIRALALVVLAIAARSAAGADATEVNGDMAILELKR